MQQDIPSRFQVLRQRAGKEWKDMRDPWNSLELTGRLNSEEVHQAVEKLSIKQGGDEKPVDVCLASNIIEVGVDIDRLSVNARGARGVPTGFTPRSWSPCVGTSHICVPRVIER